MWNLIDLSLFPPGKFPKHNLLVRRGHLLRLPVAWLLLWVRGPAWGWGHLAHKLSGEICDRYLNQTTQHAVERILGNETLAEASGWADQQRDQPTRFWQREATAYHFVTVPAGRDYRSVGPARRGDAMTALADFRADLLSGDTSLARKQLALRFAVHIIQDLHQPLHVGNGRDRGGNDFRVALDRKRTNLHRFWDSQLLYTAGRSDRQWLRFFADSGLLRSPRTEDADPLLWVQESAELRERIYPTDERIDPDYLRANLPRAEIRVALAGIRCAAWLNATLGDVATAPDSSTPSSKTLLPWWQRIL